MSSEYVRLSRGESDYGNKNLLHSELGLLTAIKCLREYKELRKQELMFKIALKSKISDVLNNLKEIDKILPKSSYKIKEKVEKKEEPREKVEEIKEEVRNEIEEDSIETELEEIRKKLAKLQGN